MPDAGNGGGRGGSEGETTDRGGKGSDALSDALDAATTLSRALRDLQLGLGECQRATPYTPLVPILRADGRFEWCCTHEPQHCSANEVQ
jgi:hypothetical protein